MVYDGFFAGFVPWQTRQELDDELLCVFGLSDRTILC